MQKLLNVIAGESVPAHSSREFEVFDPATEKVIALSPDSDARDVDAAMRAADAAFKGEWGATTPRERSLALYRIADALEKNIERFADAEALDCGKPRHSIIADEIEQSVDQLRFFAGAARTLEGRAAGEYLAEHTSYIRREPLGVVAQVTPWNYPLNMAVWKIGPALAAGNTIVLKPAATTPLSTALLVEMAQDFLPAGVLNLVLGDRETGELLTAHDTPAMFAITGSVRAGMAVAKAGAAKLTRTHLELGGKAPCVVFADADLPTAAAGIATAAFFNAGQDCTAATRVLVHERVHDEFVRVLAAHISEKVKTGTGPDSFYGPVNNAQQFANVLGFIERLPEHARVVTGGKALQGQGFFIEPTLVTGLKQDDEAVQNEIFGPVLTVQKFTSEIEALQLANGVNYALSASAWTRDHGTAMRMAKGLDFGCVWLNTHIPFVSEMPHGGHKQSGHGKDLSVYGLEEYTRIKHVMHFHGE